jgi:hypothetical protein
MVSSQGHAHSVIGCSRLWGELAPPAMTPGGQFVNRSTFSPITGGGLYAQVVKFRVLAMQPSAVN